MWELSDPTAPTFKRGALLGKFLLLPGGAVPTEWVKGGEDVEFIDSEAALHVAPLNYPATPFPTPRIGDHHPVMRSLGGQEDELPQRSSRKSNFDVPNISKGEWQAKNDTSQEFLMGNKAKWDGAGRRGKLTRFWGT